MNKITHKHTVPNFLLHDNYITDIRFEKVSDKLSNLTVEFGEGFDVNIDGTWATAKKGHILFKDVWMNDYEVLFKITKLGFDEHKTVDEETGEEYTHYTSNNTKVLEYKVLDLLMVDEMMDFIKEHKVQVMSNLHIYMGTTLRCMAERKEAQNDLSFEHIEVEIIVEHSDDIVEIYYEI